MSATTLTDETATPVAQSLRIGFVALQLATLALAAWWAAGNVRTVPPDSQAVVLRFGAVAATREAGLVLAWPRPIDTVALIPGPQRRMELRVDAAMPVGPAILDPASRLAGDITPATAAIDLTGDGGVALLDTVLTWRVSDPVAYVLAQDHLLPALRRVVLAGAQSVAARSRLDDLIAVQASVRDTVQARRDALRGLLLDEVNRRLRALAQAGAPLGVEAVRTDIAAYLPPAAKFAFDAVLEADQMAEQGLATARTDAARAGQNANHERDAILAAAHAAADERTGLARTHAAAVGALAGDGASRPSLVEAAYRERIAAILHQAGSVNTVDARGGSRLILPAGPTQ